MTWPFGMADESRWTHSERPQPAKIYPSPASGSLPILETACKTNAVSFRAGHRGQGGSIDELADPLFDTVRVPALGADQWRGISQAAAWKGMSMPDGCVSGGRVG